MEKETHMRHRAHQEWNCLIRSRQEPPHQTKIWVKVKLFPRSPRRDVDEQMLGNQIGVKERKLARN